MAPIRQPVPGESPAERADLESGSDILTALEALRATVPDPAERQRRLALLLEANAGDTAARDARPDPAVLPVRPPRDARPGESPREAELRRLGNDLLAGAAVLRAAADPGDPAAGAARFAAFLARHRALLSRRDAILKDHAAEALASPARATVAPAVPPAREAIPDENQPPATP